MTTPAAQCTRLGCDGIIDDGYCTKCGLAESPAPVRHSASPAGPATCTHPGCDGIIEDGYCTKCGLAAASALAPATGQNQGSIPGSAATNTTTGIRGTHASTGRSSRGNLGAGLVEIPPVPTHDPASAILADPQVAESQRFCSKCEQPVGRARDGQPGWPTDFVPTAAPRSPSPPSFSQGTSSAASTRCSGAWHTAGSAGSTWPGTVT